MIYLWFVIFVGNFKGKVKNKMLKVKVKSFVTLVSGLTDQEYYVILFTIIVFDGNTIAVEGNIICYFLDDFHAADMKSLSAII